MEKTKVLFYLERWSSGGIEALLNGILGCETVGSSIEAHIAAHSIENSIFTDALKKRGVIFHELSGRIRSADNASEFRKLLRAERFDAVHFNIFHGLAFRMCKIAKEECVPVRIAHSHGAGLRKSPLRPLKLLLSRIGRTLWMKHATERIACSEPAARFLFKNAEATVIKNGIDTDRFVFNHSSRERVRGELGIENELVIGHVGRFSEEKNHAFLLEVFAEIKKADGNARLLLVGDGALLDETRARVNTLGLADSVIFTGAVNNTEDYLSAMDIFLLPSTAEGFGIAAIEAQASGLPTIVSDRVPTTVILSVSAHTLPLASPKEWSDKCMEIKAFAPERKRGGEIVKKHGYSISDTAEEMLKLYKKQELK